MRRKKEIAVTLKTNNKLTGLYVLGKVSSLTGLFVLKNVNKVPINGSSGPGGPEAGGGG